MWFYVIIAACLVSCAIATGQNSIAVVGTKSELKREVAASAPTIEEVIFQERK
jgi:hypothetical protein